MVQVLIEREWGAMSDIRTQEQAQKIGWTPHLIRQLRGKHTQAAFGALLGAAKSTLWRWKARQVRPVPDIQHV